MSRLAQLLLVLAVLLPVVAMAQSAQEIVAGADAVRSPDKPFHVTATLTAYISGNPVARSVYSVYSKLDPTTRQFRDVMVYAAPARDAGKILLLNGADLWFYDPAARASIRISPQEKLSGQASAGDVLTENLAADYTASVAGAETITDGGGQKRDCWHLELKAADDQATYNRIEYWVERQSFDPIKTKFYADSGTSLKTLYYRNYVTRQGRSRPSQAVIVDAVDPRLVTTIDFGDPQLRDIPDIWFERDYLPHLNLE